MSYLKLLWALSNGASISGMVLATYRSLSHRHPPFASPNIAALSVTHSEYWHPLLPVMYPRRGSSSHRSFPIQNYKEKFKIYQQKRVEVSSLKKRKEERKREVHSPFQVANYGVQINGKPSFPSTPYPPKTPCSMRPGFGKVPTPAWITHRLSNTSNQGMRTSSYP